jgi:ribose transport system permease protein
MTATHMTGTPAMAEAPEAGVKGENQAPARIRQHESGAGHALKRLEQFGLPLLLCLLIIAFSINETSGPIFTSAANVYNLVGNQSVTALVALAMVVPLVAGYFDLSVSAITGLSNIAVASAMSAYRLPIWIAVLVGLAISGAVGFVNGFLVAKVRLNGFVVTLGAYTVLLGFVTWYTGGYQITSNIPSSFGRWSSESFFGVPRPFVILIIVASVVWYVLTQLPFGRGLEAIGSNESAARLVGISTTKSIWISFVISGLLAGAAGALQTSRGGSGDPSVGTAFLFPALTAVFLGATTIKPGKYNVWGTIVGIFFVATSVSGFTLLGADVWIQPVFNGVSLIAAVTLSTLIARGRESAAARVTLDGPPPSDEQATAYRNEQ